MRRRWWWLVGVLAAAAALTAADLALGLDTGASSTRTGAAHPATTATTAAAPASRPLPHTSAAVAAAVAQVRFESATYAADAWCSPLIASSGHSLAYLERQVAADLAPFTATQAPALEKELAPATGQIAVSPPAASSKPWPADLATADAVAPGGVNPQRASIHAAYCYSVAHYPTMHSTRGRHYHRRFEGRPPRHIGSTAAFQAERLPYLLGRPTGATAMIQIEAAYSITAAGHATYRHLWFNTTARFVMLHGRAVMASWRLPVGIAYWCSATPSAHPHYLIPELHGWAMSVPADAQGVVQGVRHAGGRP